MYYERSKCGGYWEGYQVVRQVSVAGGVTLAKKVLLITKKGAVLVPCGIRYLYPLYFSSIIPLIGGLKVVTTFHYIMAVIFAVFIVAHIYLVTTDHTPLADFIAMFTAYADKEEH
ncbi:MAG: hypothetical protein KJN62_09965 [Deltaproteobacteria bacterium]|nr:hypothetical protein [Deltaproteobacteria bacterium]